MASRVTCNRRPHCAQPNSTLADDPAAGELL
jgi:hypothetical protein